MADTKFLDDFFTYVDKKEKKSNTPATTTSGEGDFLNSFFSYVDNKTPVQQLIQQPDINPTKPPQIKNPIIGDGVTLADINGKSLPDLMRVQDPELLKESGDTGNDPILNLMSELPFYGLGSKLGTSIASTVVKSSPVKGIMGKIISYVYPKVAPGATAMLTGTTAAEVRDAIQTGDPKVRERFDNILLNAGLGGVLEIARFKPKDIQKAWDLVSSKVKSMAGRGTAEIVGAVKRSSGGIESLNKLPVEKQEEVIRTMAEVKQPVPERTTMNEDALSRQKQPTITPEEQGVAKTTQTENWDRQKDKVIGYHSGDLGKKDNIALEAKSLENAKNLKTEPEFIENSPNIGLATKEVVPVNISVEREPKDLTGTLGLIKEWLAPVRSIAEKDPVMNTTMHMARDTVDGYAMEIGHYRDLLKSTWVKLKQVEKNAVIDVLEGKPIAGALSETQKAAYDVADTMRKDAVKIASENFGIDVSKWNPETYFPHVFVGDYKVMVGDKIIEGGFAKTVREGVDKAVEYLKKTPNADIRIVPNTIDSQSTATLLSRKGFNRFIGEIKKATELDRDEILSMMKGVAAIKPRPKYVGNFLQRITNLQGYVKDEKALLIYMNRVLKKKYYDAFRKETEPLISQMQPAYKKYFQELVDDITGVYNPRDPKYKLSRNISKVTNIESKLKLGYRPLSALLNRLQPLQTAYAEIGNYLGRGIYFKRTADGKKIIDLSGVLGEMPKYATGGEMPTGTMGKLNPMYMFSSSEMANRKNVISGGYLFAQKVFQLSPEQAAKRGLTYVQDYLKNSDRYLASYTKRFPQVIEKELQTRGVDGTKKMLSAIEYAKDLNADSNFLYNMADLPKILRKPIGRLVGQFKSYPLNFFATGSKWASELIKEPTNPHYWARMGRFVSANLLLGGVRSVPYVGRQLWKLSVLTLPAGAIGTVIGRGITSLANVDLSGRIGVGEFIPKELTDILGPAAKDVVNLWKAFAPKSIGGKGDSKWRALANTSGFTRDMYNAIQDTDSIDDPNKRMRKIVDATGIEKFLQGIGMPVLRAEVQKDLTKIVLDLTDEYKADKARIVDAVITKKIKMSEGIKAAKEQGIILLPKDIIGEMKQKETPLLRRVFESTPLPVKKESIELIRKATKKEQ